MELLPLPYWGEVVLAAGALGILFVGLYTLANKLLGVGQADVRDRSQAESEGE